MVKGRVRDKSSADIIIMGPPLDDSTAAVAFRYKRGYMLETVAVPMLLKAVDFLFGEGSKILEERRKRREAQEQTSKEASPQKPSEASELVLPPGAISSREAAVRAQVAEPAWLGSEAALKHQMALLEIHTRNYYLAREQFAKWGSALVPPIIVSNLTEAENEIAKASKELQALLSRVYGAEVTAPEVRQA